MSMYRHAVAAAFGLFASVSMAAPISGSITTTDFEVTTPRGDVFYADFYELTTGGAGTVTLEYASLGALEPYMVVFDATAFGGDVLPTSGWPDAYDQLITPFVVGLGDASPGGTATVSFEATLGTIYQVALTSFSYFSDDPAVALGDYELAFDADAEVGAVNIDALTAVATPAPGTAALLALAGLGALVRRRSV